MSVYSVKGRGWRCDFTLKGEMYTEAWFKTKKEALQAEAKRREELKNPKLVDKQEETPTDITFLELVNLRLDHAQAYSSERHYKEFVYMSKRWVKRWKDLPCSSLTPSMIEQFILERNKNVSPLAANKEIRYLRSTFNYGKKEEAAAGKSSRWNEFSAHREEG